MHLGVNNGITGSQCFWVGPCRIVNLFTQPQHRRYGFVTESTFPHNLLTGAIQMNRPFFIVQFLD